MLVSFILPTIFYIAVHSQTLPRTHAVLCAGLLALGLIGMVVGLRNILYDDP